MQKFSVNKATFANNPSFLSLISQIKLCPSLEQIQILLRPIIKYLHSKTNIKVINKTICLIALDTELIFDEIEIR